MKFYLAFCLLLAFCAPPEAKARLNEETTPKFNLRKSGLELERRTQAGTFFDVIGRRAAVAGYEHRPFEVWIYPLKILDDFRLSFRLEGYPLDIHGTDIVSSINVRPEATIFTYTHAAFTVRQILFAPVDEPGVVMLLDVQSVLPMTINASFRPRLRLMWPAGLMTGNLSWDEDEQVYYITEESRRFVGIVGSPGSRDTSVMPYQEEPRDVPAQFVINVPVKTMKSNFIPIIIAGSTEGRDDAKETYERLLEGVEEFYEKTVEHYEKLEDETVQVETPDARLNTAFQWAKVGVDKGFATNPMLGTGLLAGFRTSGESERPGFAWFFGRDALWTTFALNAYGDFGGTLIALEFLKKFQRDDGRIPHEISQSATLIPWFKDYPYAWASADATPLYVIAHADYWRASGDVDYLKDSWDSILKAYRFTAATDTDKNGLVENTKFGHGWVEGGALYPPHEEIYMQALWAEASRSISELASVMDDQKLSDEARAQAERTRLALEKTYWLEARGFYAFATNRVRQEQRRADPGPNRERRQARMNQLDKARLIDEDTIMPAVALWWNVLEPERAQSQIDHMGSAGIATDWGARIISERSALYDPLSYHSGSVWPLFTGWSSLGAYRYGRTHVGFQALNANLQLTYTSALGYVTELLSGDFNTPFGRSSHHQIWSEAMVVTPLLRGLFGIEASEGGSALRFAPQFPADWNEASVRNVRADMNEFDLKWKRAANLQTINVTRRELEEGKPGAQKKPMTKLVIAPAFPTDARIRRATLNGKDVKFASKRLGDVQFVEVSFANALGANEIVFTYDEGTDVFIEAEALRPGADNQGLRILRSRADETALRLVLEGRAGRSYRLQAISPRSLTGTNNLQVKSAGAHEPQQITVTFSGPSGAYVRREFVIPFRP